MKRVFVAGLYSTTNEKNNLVGCLNNIKKGIKVCAELIAWGYYPFCPWVDFLYFLVGDERITERTIREYTISFLEVSDVMLVISNAKDSGVNAEIDKAKSLGIPTVYSIGELFKWRKENENRRCKEYILPKV
jgi:hypothetical protein